MKGHWACESISEENTASYYCCTFQWPYFHAHNKSRAKIITPFWMFGRAPRWLADILAFKAALTSRIQRVYFENNTCMLEPPRIVYTRIIWSWVESSTIRSYNRRKTGTVNTSLGLFVCSGVCLHGVNLGPEQTNKKDIFTVLMKHAVQTSRLSHWVNFDSKV